MCRPTQVAIFVLLLICVCLSSPAFSQPLTLPSLPYAYDALEPVISEATMRSHHLSHHQAYTDGVNRLLVDLRSSPSTKALSKLGLDHILQHVHNLSLPLTAPQRATLRNHGGGYINHELFFSNLCPPLPPLDDSTATPDSPRAANLSRIPERRPAEGSAVLAALEAWGGYEGFRGKFGEAAMGVFGSGWAWLLVDGQTGEVRVETTAGQDSPVMEGRGHAVLLALDVWEHAYYLDYQSRRREYVDHFWKLVDWAVVEQRLARARAGKAKAQSSHTELR